MTKTAHRCHHCGRVSRNVYKYYNAGAICGSEVYACIASLSCMRRQESKGAVFTTVPVNPPKKAAKKGRGYRRRAA